MLLLMTNVPTDCTYAQDSHTNREDNEQQLPLKLLYDVVLLD